MIQHETFIDTIGLQIDLDNDVQQQEVLHKLLGFIMNLQPLHVEKRTYSIGAHNNISKMEHLVCCNMGFVKTVVASVNSGAYAIVDSITKRETKFYISIQFAGLKSRNEKKDFLSRMYLDIICAYLKENNIPLKLNTLDIGIDVLCKFDHMLTVCTKKTANTKYHQLGEIQLYDGETTWIEKFDTNVQIQNATVRSYYYDKRAKYFGDFQTDLAYDVTRFEIKLQPKAFQASFDIKTIREQFNRYHVMYYPSVVDKRSKIDAYNRYSCIKDREIQRLGFNHYRLYPNIDSIEGFISGLFSIDAKSVFMYYGVTI
jgi:hypothetical protein